METSLSAQEVALNHAESKEKVMRALIIGASGGIGAAITAQLRDQGWDVTTLSRSEDGFDVGNAASVDKTLDQIAGPFDLIFIAVGILAPFWGSPEKALSAIKPDDMARVFAVNTIGPALILRHAGRLLPKDRRGVVATLSARVGSIGDNQIGGWHSYRASKAALNQIIHGAAIELGRSHKKSICVALHPGTVATPFTVDYAGRHKTVPAPEAAKNLLNVISDLTPKQTGSFYDYAGQEVPW
jgi:NAD(P)-dependent dehydrogenase (short-subunit alcohol dehydrogenase family)